MISYTFPLSIFELEKDIRCSQFPGFRVIVSLSPHTGFARIVSSRVQFNPTSPSSPMLMSQFRCLSLVCLLVSPWFLSTLFPLATFSKYFHLSLPNCSLSLYVESTFKHELLKF
ncbi:hypothetical transcript [Echinococcus multilocularis]|uniref:Hypothetical transcript n=1 Tax=Echinococcus multilocularis TaxID=6211 RepID=A0A087W293_ECHMU|nr:hypothetical transcript [Echinococcus multilocularis]